MKKIKFAVEYTDTFGGESNYSWVKRAVIEVKQGATQRTIMRAAKAAAGISGLRGKTYDYGDMIEFRPWRCCTAMFVTFYEGVD